jgi:beta-glucosidase
MRAADTLQVEIDVTNTGSRAGDAVVQLYIRDDVGSITRPVRQLRGFSRVALAPGEKRTLRFPITVRDLAFHDGSMRLVAEPGTFTLFTGPDAEHGESAKFTFTTPGGAPAPVADDCR